MHGIHIVYDTPHGILIIIAFIFAIGGLIRWPPPQPNRTGLQAVPWFAWSWFFFLASFLFLV